jgi:hypothetical protein
MKINTLLLAISLVETGGRDSLIGKAGERGRYQISARTWRQHSSGKHAGAHNPTLARQVATKHIEWIVKSLPMDKRQNPFHVALAWNAGLHHTLPIQSSAMDYANRVEATYRSLRELKLP